MCPIQLLVLMIVSENIAVVRIVIVLNTRSGGHWFHGEKVVKQDVRKL